MKSTLHCLFGPLCVDQPLSEHCLFQPSKYRAGRHGCIMSTSQRISCILPTSRHGCVILSTSQRIGCIGCAPLLAILRPTLAEDGIEAPTAAPMTACPVPPTAWLWLQLPWLYYFDHQLTH